MKPIVNEMKMSQMKLSQQKLSKIAEEKKKQKHSASKTINS